jgi:hypothetical protein
MLDFSEVAGPVQNAPFKFAPENGLAYVEDLGWRTVEVESLFVAARRFGQRHPGGRAWSAVALLAQ